MKDTALTTPTDDLKMRFPWSLTCKMACKALILGTDFDGAVEQGLRQGMTQRQSMDAGYKAMRSANRTKPEIK